MVDIESKIKSLNLYWVKRATSHPNPTWKLLIDEIVKDISLDNLIKGNTTEKTLLTNYQISYIIYHLPNANKQFLTYDELNLNIT